MSVRWSGFVEREPELAGFGEQRLRAAPAYIATVREDGMPRVHPVTPIFAEGGAYEFMEPTSPKGRDLRERGRFAMHNGVPDSDGTGGVMLLSGRGVPGFHTGSITWGGAFAALEPPQRNVLF